MNKRMRIRAASSFVLRTDVAALQQYGDIGDPGRGVVLAPVKTRFDRNRQSPSSISGLVAGMHLAGHGVDEDIGFAGVAAKDEVRIALCGPAGFAA